MKIDWTINLGNIIPLATFLIIIIYKMGRIENKVEIMWVYFCNNLERRVNVSNSTKGPA